MTTSHTAFPNIHKPTPTILQMEATECGAAALAIILAYYKYYVSLAEVREECGVSRDGSKAVNILKAARRYGLKAQAAQSQEWEAVFDESHLPCIVFWEFNHFVVVEGIRNNQIYINDPAVGPRIITIEEFNRAFTGVILLFKPTAEFEKQGEPFSFLDVIKRRLKNYKEPLSFILLASFALVVPGILIPGFSKIFIDDILIRHINLWFVSLLIGMLITAALRGIFTWLQQSHLVRLQTNLFVNSSRQFIWHVLHLPYLFFTQRYLGDINERVFANLRIAQLLSNGVSTGIINLVTIVFFAIVMLLISWQLATICILISLVNGWLLYFSAKQIKNLSYRFLQERGKLYGIEMNGLQIIETLKVSGTEDSFFQRWAGYHARTMNSQQQIALYGFLLQIIPQFLTALSTLVLLGLGAWFVMNGQLTLGSLVALQSLLISFNAPVITLLNLGNDLPEIRGDIARLEDVLHYPQDVRFTHMAQEEVDKNNLPQTILKIHDLEFGYSPVDPPIIHNISFSMNSKEHIAIVGITGSGKSTLAKLIATLYQPWKGEIIFAEKPIQSIQPLSLSKALAWVDQETFILEGTVRDNITLWDESISDEKILSALKDACVLDEIQLRGGLDTIVLEGGSNFSGGQRQRLEIARALIQDPAFIIFDEATNALDPITEKNIYENLKRRGCALFIIAHRLDAIIDCEQILVLDKGKIVERGKHQELIKQDGFYRRLYQLNDE